MRRSAFVLLLLLLPVVALGADKTITQRTIVEAHIDRLSVEANGGAITCDVTYHVEDAAGARIGSQRQLRIPLTPGQITTLRTFILNVVIPAVNTGEGT